MYPPFVKEDIECLSPKVKFQILKKIKSYAGISSNFFKTFFINVEKA